jgi:putative FmdB family regulatory protein
MKGQPMPLYEYVCTDCDNEFEALVKHDEQAECPSCESAKTERRLSVPGAPKVAASLPSACNPNLPPCSPTCCRL